MLIDSSTSLYTIFGNPVCHSKSPLIHNACFQQFGLNATYLAFEIKNISKGLNAMRSLNIKGASITLPFKVDVMKGLDRIDENALQIGAVNTIVNNKGVLIGYNTDCHAAITPLKPMGIKNKTVCIIGAGGAAQAVAHGIFKEKGNILILNRSQKSGENLASKVNGCFLSMEHEKKMGEHHIDILINTTSVGMFPNIDAQPFPSQYLHSDMVVMDIVYNPMKTRLLIEAQKKGCKTIDGLSMFVYQGATQFELWTGLTPDLNLMKTAAMNGDK